MILAAASGVGTCMIQLCKFRGAHSIAVSSSMAKLETCKEIGAFCGVNYRQIPNYSERVKLITDGDGVDLILDPILGSFFQENLECLGMDARWVIYGAMGGVKVKEANMMKLMGKRASILTSTLRNRDDTYKSELVADMAKECMPAFEDGRLRPIIDKVYSMRSAREALERMSENLNVGKIVMKNDL